MVALFFGAQFGKQISNAEQGISNAEQEISNDEGKNDIDSSYDFLRYSEVPCSIFKHSTDLLK